MAKEISGPGTFSLPIVGESHYQDALEAICGKRKKDGENKLVQATLILEDSNPHDEYAVRVEIRNKTVGYLSREQAKRYRDWLERSGQPKVAVSCRAVIRGGWERRKGKERGHYGVWLDMPAWDDGFIKSRGTRSKSKIPWWLVAGGLIGLSLFACCVCSVLGSAVGGGG